MKILQVFNQYRFRGGEEAWVDAIPGLLEDSFQVEELRFDSKDWLGPNKPSRLRQAFLIGDNPAARKALRAHVDRFQPEILLFHNVIPVGSLGLYFEAKKIGLPVLNYIHNFRPFSPGGTLWNGENVVANALHGNPWPEICSGSWQGSRLKTAILAWHLHKALKNGLLDCVDHWLAISDFMREHFIMAGIPEDRISTLLHCWSSPDHTPTASEDSHYLYLGRLVPEKGVETLLAAWNELLTILGSSCPLLVIAGDGPLVKIVREAAENNPHIRYAGFVKGDEKNTLLQKSKAVMVPSIWWEPLGLTTYEAYAHHRPVIASNAGGLKETVMDGLTGWSHRPNESSEIVNAVIESEKVGYEGRNKRGHEGYRWLRNHANQQIWRDQFKEIVHLLLKTSKAI